MPFCCEAQKLYSGLQNFTVAFHQHEGDKIMSEFLYLGELSFKPISQYFIGYIVIF